jgi:O-phosphoseryl-tRNA(Cys) synthetase
MTADQIERLKSLCDAFNKGALRGDEFVELVKLARMATSDLAILRSYLDIK